MPLDERTRAINALYNTASLIFDVACYHTRPHSCPHGNARRTTGNAWYCDECFDNLATALAHVAALRSASPPPLLKAWADDQELRDVRRALAVGIPSELAIYPNDDIRRVPIAIDRLDMRPLS